MNVTKVFFPLVTALINPSAESAPSNETTSFEFLLLPKYCPLNLFSTIYLSSPLSINFGSPVEILLFLFKTFRVFS